MFSMLNRIFNPVDLHIFVSGAMVGVGFLSFNWLGLFLIITCTLVAYALRVTVEEKVMLAHFGAQYAEYAGRTKRLIPWIY
jgi:protein-S-isoprenylcysteine O-methyltransferase